MPCTVLFDGLYIVKKRVAALNELRVWRKKQTNTQAFVVWSRAVIRTSTNHMATPRRLDDWGREGQRNVTDVVVCTSGLISLFQPQ